MFARSSITSSERDRVVCGRVVRRYFLSSQVSLSSRACSNGVSLIIFLLS